MSSRMTQTSLQPMSLTARLTGSGSAILGALSASRPGAVNTVVPSRSKSFDHHFLNRWMARDYKRRVMLKKYTPLRQRYVAMKRCSVLPKEIQVNLENIRLALKVFINLKFQFLFFFNLGLQDSCLCDLCTSTQKKTIVVHAMNFFFVFCISFEQERAWKYLTIEIDNFISLT